MKFFRHFTQALLFSLLVVASAMAACPSWPTATRFKISADGTEVTDTRTNLIWARCSLGQTWSGTTCTGNTNTLTHEEALTTAQARTGWRLPNVKELASLADWGCQIPSIDTTAFPNTPNTVAGEAWYWASTPSGGSSINAWTVGFYDGTVTSSSRSDLRSVRLVRINP